MDLAHGLIGNWADWLALSWDLSQLDLLGPCMPSLSSAGHFVHVVLGKLEMNWLSPNGYWNRPEEP